MHSFIFAHPFLSSFYPFVHFLSFPPFLFVLFFSFLLPTCIPIASLHACLRLHLGIVSLLACFKLVFMFSVLCYLLVLACIPTTLVLACFEFTLLHEFDISNKLNFT